MIGVAVGATDALGEGAPPVAAELPHPTTDAITIAAQAIRFDMPTVRPTPSSCRLGEA